MKWFIVIVFSLILGAACKYFLFIKTDPMSVMLVGLVLFVIVTLLLFGRDNDNRRGTIAFILGLIFSLIGGAIMSTILLS